MIKAILFDNFGVLTITDLWKEFCASLPPEQLQPARDLNHAYDAGHISKQEFNNEIEKLTGKRPLRVEETSGDKVHKNKPLINYISTLKPKYKIGLLSNIATNWIREKFLTPEEQTLFNAMIFSYEIGVTKPDVRAFEIACNKLGVQLNEAVMIDDIERYCNIAKDLGMKTIVYKDFPSMKQQLEQLLSDTNN